MEPIEQKKLKKGNLGSLFEQQMQQKQDEEEEETEKKPDRRSFKQKDLATKFMTSVSPSDKDDSAAAGEEISSDSDIDKED
mmetsp:Transcript_15791/g.19845  ORF Transcript_15791/g.19845 Transcript_15791/m.19845 type:complete len:81 (+) Transcript_15791:472-714(+)